jgi:hypothetical protein
MMINKAPRQRDLQVFGFVLPACFALAGLVVRARSGAGGIAGVVWGVGAALSLLYLAVPASRRPLFLGVSYATYPIGWVVGHVLLLAIFWLVVTPVGLLVRVLRQDPLARRLDEAADSYWSPLEQATDFRRYFQQF